MLELECVAQQYAWGKTGASSAVAQLKDAADSSFSIDDVAPYAELWMGTHPSGPSKVKRNNEASELLRDYIQSNPETLGTTTGDIPYLFKVLSVQKALSIQAHPDKKLAEQLHASHPDIYKDPNHKPEMTIALTPFEALCQFRDVSVIAEYLDHVPELSALVGEQVASELKMNPDRATLVKFFHAFIDSSSDNIKAQMSALLSRLRSRSELSNVEQWVLRLNEQFPNDIGCFCPYLLNIVTLQPGEAMFLSANEPHAYLTGDCIECMACSDNVVRAGLTPKFIDKRTLCDMLTYNMGAPSVMKGNKLDDSLRLYSAPVPEFQLEALDVAAGANYSLPQRQGPSILLIIQGKATAKASAGSLVKGKVFFVPAGEIVDLQCESHLVAYRACPNETE